MSSQKAFTLLQASQANASLARLMALQQASQARLKAIEHLIPPALQPNVKSGPLEDDVWCLLLSNNTTCAKLRQLLPAFEACLRRQDLAVKTIRLKVSHQK